MIAFREAMQPGRRAVFVFGRGIDAVTATVTAAGADYLALEDAGGRTFCVPFYSLLYVRILEDGD